MKNIVLIGIIIGVPLIAPIATANGSYRVDYPYEERVIKVSHAGNVSPTVIKTDVVITGKSVTIDNAINTNGGNVYIFAENLHIAAPIDTRVRLQSKSPYWGDGKGDKKALNYWLGRYPKASRTG